MAEQENNTNEKSKTPDPEYPGQRCEECGCVYDFITWSAFQGRCPNTRNHAREGMIERARINERRAWEAVYGDID